MTGSVAIESVALRVTVNPLVGGTIDSIEPKGLGASVLGTTPWAPEVATAASCSALDESTWLTFYGGGWPILFPNGGDACEFDGVSHGFHGEASMTLDSYRLAQFYAGLTAAGRAALCDGKLLFSRLTPPQQEQALALLPAVRAPLQDGRPVLLGVGMKGPLHVKLALNFTAP